MDDLDWTCQQLLAIANLSVCLPITWVCICRLNSAICRTHWRARVRYVLLLAAAVAHGAQPLLWATWPSPGGLLMSVAVLAGLILGRDRWQRAITEHTPCP